MIKLFVGGFPLDASELDIVRLLSPYATVSTIKIVRDKQTRKCKGYAFVEVTTESGAAHLIEMMDGSEIGDRVLSIKPTLDKPQNVKPKYTAPVRSTPSQGYTPKAASAPIEKKKRPRKVV